MKREYPTDGNADVISVIRVFNRFKEADLHKFMVNVRKALSPNGVVHLYAIDHDAAIAWAEGTEGRAASLYGPKWRHQDNWIRNWKQEDIIELFRDYGYDYTGEFIPGPNTNVQYPAFHMAFKKSNYNKTPYEYCNIKIEGEKVVDVGPGNYPMPLATEIVEIRSRLNDIDYQPDKLPKDKKIHWGNIEEHIDSISDKYFDFAYCSHVLEHLRHPKKAAAELSRIAKKGVIIVPSSYKESLMLWPEDDHIWDISTDGTNLVFAKRDRRRLATLRDSKITNFFTDIYKREVYETDEQRRVKRWFYDNEKDLDVMIYWEDSCVDKIIEV